MRRRTIWDELMREQEELFRSFFNDGGWSRLDRALPSSEHALAPNNYRQPLADLFETDKEFVATLELPGVDKKDIEVNVLENGVEVKVEKKEEHKHEEKGTYRLERSYAGFYRHIPLPEHADAAKVDASYRNGVLELRIPKREGTGKHKRISVK